MRIDGLDVQCYGPWTDAALVGLPPGPSVLQLSSPEHGVALVRFIEFVLFGADSFPQLPLGDHMPESGPISGSLTVDTPAAVYRVSRRLDPHDLVGGDELTLSCMAAAPSGGAPIPPSVYRACETKAQLRQLLGGIDIHGFRQWFVWRADQLGDAPDGSTSDDLSRRAYDFAVKRFEPPGDDAAPKHRAEWLPGGVKRAQRRLSRLARLQTLLENRLRSRARLGLQYTKWVSRQEKLQQATQQQRRRIGTARRRLRLVRMAGQFHARRRQLEQIEQAMSGAEPGSRPVAAPMGIVPDRAEEIAVGVERCRQAIRRAGQQQSQLRGQIRGLTFAAVHTAAVRARTLLDQAKWMLEAEVSVEQIDAQVSRLRDLSAAPAARVMHAAAAPEVPVTVDAPGWESLRPLARELCNAGRALRQMRAELSEASGTDPAAKAKAGTDPRRAEAKQTDEAIRQSTNRLNLLRRRAELDHRAAQMRRNQQSLRTDCDRLRRRQMLPIWAVGLLGGLFVLGLVAVTAGLLLTSPNWNLPLRLQRGWRWLLVLVGGTFSFAAAMIRLSFSRLASDHYLNWQRQLRDLQRQIQQAVEECEALDIRLGSTDQPLAERIARTERELVQLRKAAAADGPGNAAAAARQSHPIDDHARPRRAKAQDRYESARKRWRDALTSRGLPEDLTPRDVRKLARPKDLTTDQATGNLDPSADQQMQRLGRRREQELRRLSDWRRECRQLFDELGLGVAGDSVSGISHQLQELLCKHRGLRRRRRKLMRQYRRVRHLEQRLHQRQRQLQQLQQTSPCQPEPPEEAGDNRPPRHSQAASSPLAHQRDQLKNRLEITIDKARANRWLAAVLEMEDEQRDRVRRHCLAQLKRHQERLEGVLEMHGRCCQRLAQLTRDRRNGRLQLRLDETKQRILQLSRQLRQRRMADRLLKQAARRNQDRNHLRRFLDHASEKVRQWTAGQLTCFRADGKQPGLQVEDGRGKLWSLEQRGPDDLDAIRWSLRLARLQQLADQGIRLPVLVLDIFARQDPGHLVATCRLLQGLAREGHQLIMLVGHPSRPGALSELNLPILTFQDQPVGQFQPQDRPYEVIGPVPLECAGDELQRLYTRTLGDPPLADQGATKAGPERQPKRAPKPPPRQLVPPRLTPPRDPREPSMAGQAGSRTSSANVPNSADASASSVSSSTDQLKTPPSADDLPDWWPD